MNTRIKTDTGLEVLHPDKVTQFLKFEDSENGSELDLIIDMIRAVRVHFEKRTGLSLIEKTYETFFRHEESPYVLPISPVISVDKVESVDHEGTKIELILNNDYHKRGLYEIEIFPYSLYTANNPWYSFDGTLDLLVTYKAGYGHPDTEPVPEDIKQAMLRQIIQWYENRDDFRELNLMPGIEKIIQRYRKVLL